MGIASPEYHRASGPVNGGATRAERTLAENEFLYALILLAKSGVRTVPVGAITELIRGDVFHRGQLMAAALMGSVPVAIIYTFFVDGDVAGLTAGSVKS